MYPLTTAARTTISRLLSCLLACALLGQAVLNVADWCCLPLNRIPDHCLTDTHPAEKTNILEQHSHRCCHTTPSNIAILSVYFIRIPFIAGTLIPVFFPDHYLNPLAKQLIRPPIA